MEAYGAAKAKLFHWEGLKHAVINVDDPFGRQLVQDIDASQTKVVSYGLTQGDVRPLSLTANLDGLHLQVTTPWGEVEVRTGWWADSMPATCWPVWPPCASTASA
jgi:UDP-N-acetylmuramoyl-L-alanyl-D-glutamate--2,6-diaminopimelate ligase